MWILSVGGGRGKKVGGGRPHELSVSGGDAFACGISIFVDSG